MTMLADVVDGGPAAWQRCGSEALATALREAGPSAAHQLRDFCQAVEVWLHDAATDTERRARNQWIDTVADEFLQGLDGARIADLTSSLVSVDEQLDFLVVLTGRESARFHVGAGIRVAAQNLGTQASQDSSADWERCFRTLVQLHVAAARDTELLADTLRQVPSKLVERLLTSLGLLRFYDQLRKPLAAALVAARSPEVSRAAAEAFARTRSIRMGELLELIARAGSKPTNRTPAAIAPGEAHRFLAEVEAALLRGNHHAERDLLSRYRGLWRNDHAETQRMLSS